MKRAFENHVTQFPLTDPDFAFGVKNNVQHQGCEKCNKLLKVMELIKQNIDEQRHQLFDDCYEKLYLYLGHRDRVVNQMQTIDNLLHSLLYDEAYCGMDFKMKYEEMRFREKTTKFYGKKGIIGTVQWFIQYIDIKNRNQTAICSLITSHIMIMFLLGTQNNISVLY